MTLKDPNKLLSDVSSRFGAPMGRRAITENVSAKVRLFRIRLVDGDYDHGGAYWGGGSPLYCALGDGFQMFRRAESREEAKELLLDQFPTLRFYR
jgi:hypothetical protein